MGTEQSRMNRHSDANTSRIHPTMNSREFISSEEQYIQNSELDHRKSLGQFFTPTDIANAMATWIGDGKPESVLDPAVGTGVLLKSVKDYLGDIQLEGWDIDAAPLEYAKRDLGTVAHIRLEHGDFLKSDLDRKFDAVIANPPYVRHHLIDYGQEHYRFLSEHLGKIPKTSNLYVLFIGAILKSLVEGGRAAILVPSDWMNSNFGASLKTAFQQLGVIRRIAYFCNTTMPFSDNLSTAVILFIENSKREGEVEIVLIDELLTPSLISQLGNETLPAALLDHTSRLELNSLDPLAKWTSILKGIHSEPPIGWRPLKEFSRTRRGIATGANDYFLISAEKLAEAGIHKKRTRKCVGRAKDVRGLVFRESDFNDLEKTGAPTRLLDLDEAYETDASYIQLGVAKKLPQRFLLANRKPWYSQENREPAPIWVGVFGREGIRFIWNKASVSNLTTFHCLYPEINLQNCGVLVALLNSSPLQDWNSRSERSYGGGLQKVEPKDILEMYVPVVEHLSTALKDQLLASLEDADALHKGGSANWRMPLDQIVSKLDL